ncbi:hypothetical protein B0F87_11113 [Methylobacter tundripaludum]|uniref:Uncharacterized protein n=1 Tax=Methylobacter tundripaludum TaxID=173365 RepID=A0A2S6H9K6_9GAMM|nr:hypothetical protein [Methylobacter tundripaludum]PPK74083.1 hypothetical protein B0F87_11113 [Methylobacter tundripaludum]
MNVSADKQYENITTQLRYLNDKIHDAFRHFFTLASAIIGGSLYAHITLAPDDPRRCGLGSSASALLSIVGVAIVILIATNFFSKQGYRKRLSLEYPAIPLGTSKTEYAIEASTCVLIVATCVGFWFLNPL